MKFDDAGNPAGVERLGIALEPEAEYELRPDGSGGCEDPRITYGEDLKRYVMTYTALSPKGPRIALALSEDLFHWQRLGLATFRPYEGIEFDGVDNKDASDVPRGHSRSCWDNRQWPSSTGRSFPELVRRKRHADPASRVVDLHRESIWISYCPLGRGWR